jgi:hypothetical protein
MWNMLVAMTERAEKDCEEEKISDSVHFLTFMSYLPAPKILP